LSFDEREMIGQQLSQGKCFRLIAKSLGRNISTISGEVRFIPGFWESDLLIGKVDLSALGSIVERTTGTVILVSQKDRDTESVR
jgi:IS30 family transposase